jgi:predicted HAD superfamily Cof-like phosphohydrolase
MEKNSGSGDALLQDDTRVLTPEERAKKEAQELHFMRMMMQRKLQMVEPSGRAPFFSQFDFVCQFHVLMDTFRNIDYTPTPEDIERRMKIINEEVNVELFADLEKLRTGEITWSLEHRARVLDHLVDCLYVIYGTAAEFGLPIDNAFMIVHSHNMAKFANGVKKNEYGKLIKPEGWQPPDRALFELVKEQYEAVTAQGTNLPEPPIGTVRNQETQQKAN